MHLIETKAVLNVEYLSVRGLSMSPKEMSRRQHVPDIRSSTESWAEGALTIVGMLVESPVHAPWGWDLGGETGPGASVHVEGVKVG